jgi:large subunit ribosomal protein L7Ae
MPKKGERPFYVKFETPEDLMKLALQTLEVAKETGKVRRGTNETTKAVERNEAKLVMIAEDVDPPEVVAHLPELCDERGIPYLYINSKSELGKMSGINVGAASVCIVDFGEAGENAETIISKLKRVKK